MPVAASLFVLLLVHSVPGAMIAVHWQAMWRRLRLAERLALSVGLSSGLILVNGLVLVRLNRFSPIWIWRVSIAEWVALAASVAFLLFRNHQRLRWIRPTTASVRFAAVASVGLGVTMVLYLKVYAAGVPQVVSSWRYALDARNLLEAGGIPSSSVQWGIERPFALSKIGGSIWLATIDVFGMWSPAHVVQWAPFVFLVIGIVGIWVLFREMTGKWGTLAAVLVLFAGYPFVRLLPAKMSRLTIEMIGFGIAVVALWALIASFRYRSSGLRWLAAGLIALTGLTHGVAFLVVAIAVAAYLGGRLLGRASTFREVLVAGLLVLAVPVVFLWSGVAVGEQSEITGSVEGFQLIDGTKDPTQALLLAIQGLSIHDADPPPQGFEPSAMEYASNLVERSVGRFVPIGRQIDAAYPVVLVLIVLLFIAGWILVPTKRTALIAIGLFGIGIYAVGPLFTLRYDIWIYAEHAMRREYGYFAFAVVALVTVVLTGVLSRFQSKRWQISIKVAVVVMVVSGMLVTALYQTAWQREPWSEDEIRAMDWIAVSTDPDDRILLNVRTAGSVGLLADRVSVTEGGTPYLFPDLLDHALFILDRTQAWYRDPSLEFLENQGIDYVVAVTGGKRVSLGGNVFVRFASTKRLDAEPYLVEVARFGPIAIYERQ